MPEIYLKMSLKSFEGSALQPAKHKIEELCALADSREALLRSILLPEALPDAPLKGEAPQGQAPPPYIGKGCKRGLDPHPWPWSGGSFVPLPSSKKRFTLLRSPHIDKKSREQFQLETHKAQIETACCSREEACLLLLLLKNSELMGVQVKVAISYSTPFCP